MNKQWSCGVGVEVALYKIIIIKYNFVHGFIFLTNVTNTAEMDATTDTYIRLHHTLKLYNFYQ